MKFKPFLLGLLLLQLAMTVALISCSSRQLNDVAGAADGGAAVAVWFGPVGVAVAGVLTALSGVLKVHASRLQRALESERQCHALTKEKLKEYTAAETIKESFPETDRYAPTESEIIAKVSNGHHEFTKPSSDAGPRT